MSAPCANLLTDAQAAQFGRDGVLVVPGFYDVAREVEPIQRDIHKIIGILIGRHAPHLRQAPFKPDQFDSGFQDLIAQDRRLGGVVYDAVKQIPAFVRLTVSEKHDRLMRQLRGSDLPGVAAGGSGIRIDHPHEERFRANWHQDYPSQFRSLDGLVFWSPLLPLTEEMGPLQIALGSHREGLAPVLTRDPDHPEKSGAYALRLKDEAGRIARYQQISPLLAPGDLAILDFLNLHASGHNRAQRSRWSMQIRYFNFREPTGQRIEWAGSFAAGRSLREIHPELVAD